MMNTQPNNARRAAFQAAQQEAAKKRHDIGLYIAERRAFGLTHEHTGLAQRKAKA
jgi:dihydroorotase-like cyclic amidohydrolase